MCVCVWLLHLHICIPIYLAGDSYCTCQIVFTFCYIYGCGGFRVASTRLWLSMFFLSFVYVMDAHKKIHLHQFSDFLKFSGRSGRNHRVMRAIIDSFKIYTINSLMKKKISPNFVEMAAFLACNARAKLPISN